MSPTRSTSRQRQKPKQATKQQKEDDAAAIVRLTNELDATKQATKQRRIKTNGAQRTQIEILKVRRRWLNDHLILVIMLQTVWIFTIATILRAARWLHVSGFPLAGFLPSGYLRAKHDSTPRYRLNPEKAQNGLRMLVLRSFA